MNRDFLIEQVWEGKNVRHWKVSRGAAGEMVTVRESALAPGVYACLKCLVVDCPHAMAVKAIDAPSCVTVEPSAVP